MSVREPSKPTVPDDRKPAIDVGAAAVLEKKIDARAVAAMLREWNDEDARDTEPPESLEEFKRALDANRHSARKLFP